MLPMARISRTVVSGLPHHVTQRGNRRLMTFFDSSDYRAYIAVMRESCDRFEVEIWAWCLMPNHIHLIAVPHSADGLRLAIGDAHRQYTAMVNERQGWTGHLWQGRFASFVMDERYTLAAARYIELNPVRAGLVALPADYPWSSARAHLTGRDDALSRTSPLLELVDDWARFLGVAPEEEILADLRKHQSTGRPLGTDRFLDQLEGKLGRSLRPRRPGPPPGTKRKTTVGDQYGVPGSPTDIGDQWGVPGSVLTAAAPAQVET